MQPRPGLNSGRTNLGPRLSEDCLTLNVWSPGTEGRRAVMVWIHGGAFMGGSGALYRGGPLATLGDIVVVTINYRLGIFGFVNLGEAIGDTRIESNLGLRDIVAALRWVRANIAGFGGDPGRVTLAGQSAGAIATALLMLSDEASPLFHQAIQQSGAIDLAHSRDMSLRVARRYAGHLGPEAKTLETLQRLPAQRLIAAQVAVSNRIEGVAPASPWFDDDLLPATIEAARSKRPPGIPLLAGFNRDDITLFKGPPLPKVLPIRRPELRRLVTRDLDAAVAARVLRAYPNTVAGSNAFATDLYFAMPIQHGAERNAISGSPTWLYRFDYAHPLLGASHALDLLFLWPFPGLLGAALRGGFLTGLRSGLSERMRSAWASFVRTGSPGDDWPSFTLPERQTRLFALQDRIVVDPMRERRAAWAGQDVAAGR